MADPSSESGGKAWGERRHPCAAWLREWRPIAPILFAEFVVWTGFTALLPVLPLLIVEKGVDPATLGFVIAAWPAALLVASPLFGWIADRTSRLPFMAGGLLAGSVFALLPLFVAGAIPFLLLRAASGIAAAAYDPTTRAYLLEETPTQRHGEVFGLYNSAQMGGLLIGPAIGGLGAGLFGGHTFPFVFAAAGSIAAALVIAVSIGTRSSGMAETSNVARDESVSRTVREVRSFANSAFIIAVIFGFSSFFAQGIFEVVWTLFLTARGASLGLIGLTFVAFGFPVFVLSPTLGRIVDKFGAIRFLIFGSLPVIGASLVYPLISDPVWTLPVVLLEGLAFAMFGPALYALGSQGSPAGGQATGQGILGSGGTLGFVVASIVAGNLYVRDIRYPFWAIALESTFAISLALIVLASRKGRLILRWNEHRQDDH